jgi:hypothetical protein
MASGWSISVPYHPDIQTAYQQARQQAFATGEYLCPASPDAAVPLFSTIADLVAASGFRGTHSILDHPETFTPTPWSAATQRRVVGSLTPTMAQIEGAATTRVFWDEADGDYLIAYADGVPVSITFFGATGN